MGQFTPVVPSFNGGELSERMMGRVDQALYQVAAAEMLNFVPTVEGPAMKRPGFRHIRAAMASASWLSTFIFSVTQSYIVEWGEETLRFFTNGGRVETGPGVPYELAVPYSAAEAPAISQQQNFDRLYLAHPSHAPASLLRTSATTFSHAELVLKNGPFADRNSNEAITVTASGTTGSITITATSAIFLAGHIGGPFMVEPRDFSDVEAWEPNVNSENIDIGDKRRSDGKVYEAVAKKAGAGKEYTGTNQPTHTRGEEWDGSGDEILGAEAGDVAGVKWRYLYDRFGVGTITAVGGGGTTATVSVTRRLADSLVTTGSFRWSLPAISAATGFPKINLLAFGRLIYFTDFEIIASVVGDFGGGTVNMAPFTESGLLAPDMAFRRRLALSNPILWAKEDRDVILIGTADGTYAIRKVNSSEIFSSDNIECVRQSHYGASPVPPAQTGTSTIFVQLGGRKLREADYSLERDRYTSPNINIWQRHVLKSGAKQLAFQAEPEELLWAVRNDGVLALHPHVPEQEVRGFARLTHSAGAVLSAAAIPTEDGSSHEIWALVDGDAGKSVEQQAQPWAEGETDLADAFYVDSGATYSGAATTTISGLDHLAGKDVAVLANGAVVPGMAVDDAGKLVPNLPLAAEKVHVGLGYQARITWLRPEVRDGGGNTIQGKRKRLVSIILRVLETAGIKVDPGTGKADNIIDRPGSAPMNEPVPPFTGDTVAKSLSGNWGRDGQGTIISDDPLPCMIVAAIPKIEVGS